MSSNAQIIWNFLKREGFSDCGRYGSDRLYCEPAE